MKFYHILYICFYTIRRLYSLTELSPSWGTANCAATQNLPSILWNPKVQYRVHKSPPLFPILSHINPIHTIPSYLRSILILSTHLRLGLPSGLFPFGFPTNILCIPILPHSWYMPSPSHPSWIDHSSYTWSTSYEAPHYAAFSNLLLLHPSLVQIFSSTSRSQTPSINVREKVSQPYKTTGKIIVL
jgi:hypothetical protein